MEGMRYFGAIAPGLNSLEIQAWKQAGARVIGTVCSNIPEEVLHAAGLLPVRLRAPDVQDTSGADSYLHRINCSYTRSVLELLLRGDLRFLDGLVITNTCDHLLRLAGELEDKAKFPFVHYFSMYHAQAQSGRKWFVLEMEELIRHIEEAFGTKVTEPDIRRSISVYNRTRRLMARLNESRKNDPPALSGAEYLQIALAGMSIPREQFNDRLEALLPEIEGRRFEATGLPRLMVVGGACDAPGFIDSIERKGAVVVADGLCFGMRHYQGIIDQDAQSPLEAIADRYTSRAPCPAIMDGFDHGYSIYRQIINGWGVDGVICARLKFCDHWGGARKMLADELRKHGIPLLDLEREYSTIGSGQMSTRVQAFLEMMRD